MKITQPMLDALRKLDGHEIRGNTINTGERLHILNWLTVKALYRRGLLTYTGEHCWAEQYSVDGELMHRYTVPVYVMSETGKEALVQAKSEVA